MNNSLLNTYWSIGKIIVEFEQKGERKAEYGAKTLQTLSKELTKHLGKGFSVSNLLNIRKFYLNYSNIPDASVKLTWSHYCEILSVSDSKARLFYEHECVNSNWSVRELKIQINTSLFQRLLLSDGNSNKQKLIELANDGVIYNKPSDLVKDPYVLEFLGLKDRKPIKEKELEAKLIKHLEDFLLELGRGFMFVGSQYRITINNEHYYVDLVFYNKILKTYMLIDLKIGNLKPDNFGQMNMYLNYFENEVNEEGDNKPIGIILCAEKDKVVAKYSLEGLKSNIFASKYT